MDRHSEGEHNAGVIADALGWYASDRTQVISRLPIVDPPGADGRYVWVEALPGRFVAIGNVHLPSDPCGPYEIRDGATRAEVLALERSVRLPAIQDHLAALPPLAAAGMPVFLTGDFNSPSHLEWTAAVQPFRARSPRGERQAANCQRKKPGDTMANVRIDLQTGLRKLRRASVSSLTLTSRPSGSDSAADDE